MARQPGVLGGGKKTLKTSIALDMGLSLATGLPFLGHFPVKRRCGVILLSGESGLGTLKETLRRICKSKGIRLPDVEGLFLSEWMPRFDSDQNLASLDLTLQETKSEVLIIDPTYFCMRGDNAGNLFSQGESLRGIKELCQGHGVSLVLVHHSRKRSKNDSVYGPPELDNLVMVRLCGILASVAPA